MAKDFFGDDVDDDFDPLAPTKVKAPAPTAPVNYTNDHRRTALRTANTNAAPGGFNDQRGAQIRDALALNTRIGSTSAGRAGVEVPFLGSGTNNPIKNTVNTAFETAQGAPLHAAEMAAADPLMTLATGGTNVALGAGDRAVDLVGSGLARDITGDPEASINAPLTPGQIWDPNGPLYKDSNTTIQQPGLKQVGAGIGDFLGGLGGGGGGAGGGSPADVAGLRAEQAAARDLGIDVLSGEVGAPNPADRGLQMTELERIQNFLSGPREQRNVLSDVDAFLAQPRGPSAAELQLRQAQDDSMSDALSLARGVRGGAGAQARAGRVAVAENAATQATSARDMALLRAKEDEAHRAQVLEGLGLKGDLAGGLDQNTLQALGLSSGTAGDIRGAGVTERGQNLGFAGDMVGDSLGSSTELNNALMRDALERTKLGYELTPDQKMLFAGLGAGSDLLSLFL